MKLTPTILDGYVTIILHDICNAQASLSNNLLVVILSHGFDINIHNCICGGPKLFQYLLVNYHC